MHEIWHFSTARFRVSLGVDESINPDLSWMDADQIAMVRDGSLTIFDSRVAVYCDGVMIGADYLGESVHSDPRDFIRGDYFRDMVREAIAAARQHMATLPRLRA